MSQFILASPPSTPSRRSTPANTPSIAHPSTTTTTSDSDEDDDLPYPEPLQRDPFLDPDFSPVTYLSTLRNRHQTLADLRNELRTRSQALQKELLDLVNGEYQAFLDLGRDLSGGEEKVEGVRVGVMGFVNGVGGVKRAVETRRVKVDELLVERRRLRGEIELGRDLVEVHLRIGEVEDVLVVGEGSEDDDYGFEYEEEEEEEEDGLRVGKLRRLVRCYTAIKQLIKNIGPDHPFLVTQEERLMRVRNTLLLDLGNALKQARAGGVATQKKLMQIILLYGEMDEAGEATKVLQEGKPAKR